MDELTPQAADATPLETPPIPSNPAGGEASASGPADGDGSLSDHEAAHGAAVADPDTDRDEQGKFTPKRRRADSQRADADDVPVINELTKRIKTFEETHGKDITRKPGESERVYNLRRRAEVVERLASQPKPQAATAPAPQPHARQSQPIAQSFPAYEAFIAMPGYEQATYEDYSDARADWRFAIRREQERQQDAQEREQRTQVDRASDHGKRVSAAKQAYTDWDTVVSHDVPISRVIEQAVLASAKSADIQYYLGQHRDELAQLVSESQDYSPSAVQAMRRYLDTLVAPQRSSPSSLPAAGPTGAALKLATPPAPRPPTPVRTGAVTSADDPPGDDSQSLAAHEKFYARARR